MKSSILGPLSPEHFLKNHWQKKPLLIRQAFSDFDAPITADELAGLALEAEVESRIVLEHGSTPWELRNGPFSESDFSTLPESHWTLLVQAVDHWVPEVHELFEFFSFLPSWRLDDIMISYATDGGSVGPHYDQYDVFLLQAEGKRRWQIGPVYDASAPRVEGTDLHILSKFDVLEDYILEPGDMLYLPPGVGHHGAAVGDCMTISIGFRAPSHKEILMHFTDFLADRLPDHLRYSDSDIELTEAPGEIDSRSLDRVQGILRHYLEDKALLGQWFGEMMTMPKYEQETESDNLDWLGLLDECDNACLMAGESSRLAYLHNDSDFWFFTDGEGKIQHSPEAQSISQQLCNEQRLPPGKWQKLADQESRQLLLTLFNNGIISAE